MPSASYSTSEQDSVPEDHDLWQQAVSLQMSDFGRIDDPKILARFHEKPEVLHLPLEVGRNGTLDHAKPPRLHPHLHDSPFPGGVVVPLRG